MLRIFLSIVSLINAFESPSNDVEIKHKILAFKITDEMENDKNGCYQTSEIRGILSLDNEGNIHSNEKQLLHVYIGIDIPNRFQLKRENLLYWGSSNFSMCAEVLHQNKNYNKGLAPVAINQPHLSQNYFFEFSLAVKKNSFSNKGEKIPELRIETCYNNIQLFVQNQKRSISSNSYLIVILTDKTDDSIFPIDDEFTILLYDLEKKPENSWYQNLFKSSNTIWVILLLVVCFACVIIFYFTMRNSGQTTEKLNDEQSI